MAAIGCTRDRSHSGIGWSTSSVPIWRITSNDVDPAPITTPARSATDEAEEASSSSSTSRREVMCSESSSRGTCGHEAGEVDQPGTPAASTPRRTVSAPRRSVAENPRELSECTR